jgi:signal peptidase I
MNGDGLGSPPWGPADPVPDLDDTQAIPGLGSIPGPNGPRGPRSDGTGPDGAGADGDAESPGGPAAGGGKNGRSGKSGRRRRSFWRELPVLVIVALVLALVIKSFAIQAFFIPSASMENTLEIGDRVLINKIVYHLRPIHRGDIIVFDGTGSWDFDTPPASSNIFSRAVDEMEGLVGISKDPNIYIKRVIGLPGDTVAYQDKQLTINGQPVPETPMADYFDEERMNYAKQFEETLGTRKNAILNNPGVPPFVMGAYDYPYRDNCEYNSRGVICKVPPGHYFMMGDNRDNSADSRYWGFVPDKNIVGRAFFIWMNFSNLKRIGSFN